MTYRSRTIIFLIIALAFFVITPIIALYAQGWRYDFEKEKWVEIGGLLLESEPKGAEIFLDGRRQKQETPVFLKTLKPGNYSVLLNKDGFRDWAKTLTVEARLVTEIRGIALIPEEPQEIMIENEPVKIFAVSLNAKEIAVVTESASGDVVKIKSLEAKIGEEAVFTGIREETVENIAWGPFGRNVILKIRDRQETKWLNYDRRLNKLENAGELVEATAPTTVGAAIENIFPHIRKSNFIVFKEGKLFDLNTGQKTMNLIYEDAVSPSLIEENIVFFDKKSLTPWKYSLVTEKLERIANDTLPPYARIETKSFKNSIIAVLGGDGDLLVNFPDPQKMTLIKGEVSDAVVSRDGSQLIYATASSIRILWLKNQTSQPFKKQGEEEIIFNSPYRDISKIIMAGKNDNYVIFNTEKNIRFQETDVRRGSNEYLLASGLEGSFRLVDGGKSLLFQKLSGELALLKDLLQ